MSQPIDNVADWISIPEAGERLGIVPGKVRRLIEEHSLIAVKRDGVFMIPAELIANGEALPSLKGTILVLLDSGFSLMSAINWLYTDNDVLRGTPMSALVSGRKTEVRRIAQSLAL